MSSLPTRKVEFKNTPEGFPGNRRPSRLQASTFMVMSYLSQASRIFVQVLVRNLLPTVPPLYNADNEVHTKLCYSKTAFKV